MIRSSRRKSRAEPTIALINVVFLMLVFFMVAGALAPPMDPVVRLVKAADLETAPPPDALVVRQDGTLTYRGAELTSTEAFVRIVREEDTDFAVRIVPDRDLPARALVAIANELKQQGASRVVLLSERSLK